MTRRALAIALLTVFGLGCRQTRCEDLVPAPLPGKYRGGGSLGQERLLNVALDVSPQQVILTYTTLEGERIRAKYRIAKKTVGQ